MSPRLTDFRKSLDTAAANAACAGVTVNDIMNRAFVSTESGGDPIRGNFFARNDRFTNTRTDCRIVLTGVDVLLLNPEDVGFADVNNGNAYAVQAVAIEKYPDYPFWGISFWYSEDGGPLDVPRVNWISAEFPGAVFPDTLDFSASFILTTIAHNDILGPVDASSSQIGELVIGWRFSGKVLGPGPGTIPGTVVDSLTRRPLDGVRLNTNPTTYANTTDAAGTYTFQNVEPGSYSITASRFGYNDNAVSVEVVAAATSRANIALMPDRPPVLQPVSDQTVLENQIIALSIVASDPDGDPFSLSAVDLPSGASFSPTSSTQGRFTWQPAFGLGGRSFDVTFQAREQRPEALEGRMMVRFSVLRQLPDLVATALVVDSLTISAGQTQRIVGTVINRKAPFHQPFHVAMLENGVVVSDTLLGGMQLDETLRLEAAVTLTQLGSNVLTLSADVEGELEEEQESNNTMELTVQVVQGRELVVRPIPFTPNGDGYNDHVRFDFTKFGLAIPRLKILSFEGRLVRSLVEKKDLAFEWDGRDDQGREQAPGIYLYVVQDGEDAVASGHVVLAR